MRTKDIVIGKTYRLKSSPQYGYIKVLEIIKPRQLPNTSNRYAIKCEHTVCKDDNCGFIRYFKLSSIIECE